MNSIYLVHGYMLYRTCIKKYKRINHLVLSQLAKEGFMAVTALSPVHLTVRRVDTQTDYVPVRRDGRVTTVRTVTFF